VNVLRDSKTQNIKNSKKNNNKIQMRLSNLVEQIQQHKFHLVNVASIIEFMVIGLFVAYFNPPLGAQLFFTAVALLMFYYVTQTT